VPSTPSTKIATDVEQGDQRDQLLERADAILSDRIGDRAEHAERRHAHDQPHRPEQHRGYRVDQRGDLLALLAADQSQAGAEQNREEQHLQHVIARQRVEGGGGDDVQQEAADPAALQLVGIVGIAVERLGIERRRIDVHAVARAEQIGEQQADHQRHRGHHLEIDQSLDADPPDLLQIAGAGDAVHDHAEHDRGHDHRNQLQKGVAEDLQPDGEIRSRYPQHDAEQQRRQDLDEQRRIQRPSRDFRSGGDSCHRSFPPHRFQPE